MLTLRRRREERRLRQRLDLPAWVNLDDPLLRLQLHRLDLLSTRDHSQFWAVYGSVAAALAGQLATAGAKAVAQYLKRRRQRRYRNSAMRRTEAVALARWVVTSSYSADPMRLRDRGETKRPDGTWVIQLSDGANDYTVTIPKGKTGLQDFGTQRTPIPRPSWLEELLGKGGGSEQDKQEDDD
jgi:hypothetical protein